MGAPWIKQFREVLAPVLTEQQMQVLESRLYEALIDSDTLPSEALAKELEVTRQRVHQVWGEAIEQLRQHLSSTRLSPNTETASKYMAETMANLESAQTRIKNALSAATLASGAMTVGVRKLRPGGSNPVIRGMVPSRIYNRLEALGVHTMEDFSKVKSSTILNCRGCGRDTLEELRNNLAVYGVMLGD